MQRLHGILFAVGLVFSASFASSQEAPLPPEVSPPSSVEQNQKEKSILELPSIPHLRLDRESRFIDLDATVCLHEGKLELIACTSDTKVHESIVAIEAVPKHLHFMLVLLRAVPGHPPHREAIDETQTRWRDIPARGHPIKVSLVYETPAGEQVERPINQFVRNSKGTPFPSSTFLFAGSTIKAREDGPGIYLADFSGHVIAITSFGDEVLTSPTTYSHANQDLLWEVSPQDLPEPGSEITLRLRPVFETEKRAKN